MNCKDFTLVFRGPIMVLFFFFLPFPPPPVSLFYDEAGDSLDVATISINEMPIDESCLH